MILGEYRRQLRTRLEPLYGNREASSIVDVLLAAHYNVNKSKLLMLETRDVATDEVNWLEAAMERLLKSEPVQYVVGKVEFMDLELKVDASVLIPRPETEELVRWAIEMNKTDKPSILDIGTGSGCIAIALKMAIKDSDVWAIDISQAALEIAKQNAIANDAAIDFRQMDILNNTALEELPKAWDMIVSNPPYIPVFEIASLPANVSKYEPPEALYCEKDPLLFYRAIGRFALGNLRKGGLLFFELHEKYAEDVKILLDSMNFSEVSLKLDVNDKCRMLCAFAT